MRSGTETVNEGVWQIVRANLLELPSFIGRGLRYHAAGRIYTPKPIVFALGVTRRCNSRCVMCSIWRTKPGTEPTLGKIQEIFSNPVLNRLETVILTGGEPTLRDDLAQIVQVILDSNPRVKEIGLVTNALEPSLVGQRVKDILDLPAYPRLKKLEVQVSLDGYGDIHTRIRRVPQAFDRVKESIKVLRGLQLNSLFRIYLSCTVQKLNVDNLPQISEFAREVKLPIAFSPVIQALGNKDDFQEYLMPSDDQLRELKDFLNHRIEHNIRLPTAAFWQDYFRIIQGEKRRLPCALVYHALGMDPEGSIFICGNESTNESLIYGNVYDTTIGEIWYSDEAEEIRKRARKYICPTCPASCNISFSFRQEFFYFASFLLKEETKKLLGR
jgi:radical SAM protein with 4Fe4S-binding SPASM domain